MNKDNIQKLISVALAIEEEDAKEAGSLGYMARMLVQVTMPHSNPKVNVFERTNGNFSLAMSGHPKIGLPYGIYPRLLLAWVVTEAVKKKSPTLVLGSSFSSFMSELGLLPTGGRWGTISRLKDQMRRLFSSSVSCVYDNQYLSSGSGFSVASEYHLWWDPKLPKQAALWESTVTLSQEFFKQVVDRPVPVDMRVLSELKGSSLALDLYCWLTYRMSYLRRRTEIPWLLLQKQFGANYANNKSGRSAFKTKLKEQLNKVLYIYDNAKVEEGNCGLILLPSKSHIRQKKITT